ncbi:hypothetical protein ACFCP7_14320 [Paenibacillus elgii]
MGLIFGILFVQRQRRLADPLLDMTLFANRTFSVALLVLLFGLVTVGGTMLLVVQYLQLVAGYSPSVAGLWMGLAALAMIVGGVKQHPLIARYVRPGFVVAGSLGLSTEGYLDPDNSFNCSAEARRKLRQHHQGRNRSRVTGRSSLEKMPFRSIMIPTLPGS